MKSNSEPINDYPLSQLYKSNSTFLKEELYDKKLFDYISQSLIIEKWNIIISFSTITQTYGVYNTSSIIIFLKECQSNLNYYMKLYRIMIESITFNTFYSLDTMISLFTQHGLYEKLSFIHNKQISIKKIILSDLFKKYKSYYNEYLIHEIGSEAKEMKKHKYIVTNLSKYFPVEKFEENFMLEFS